MFNRTGMVKAISGISYWKILFFLILIAVADGNAQNKEDVFVDSNGVMRWEHNKQEVEGFGVNYSVPFAHAYRTAENFGINIKEAIDNDVYHFSRLGFDLFRIHVWDTEISDEEGNLLENEHLEIFDYLLKKLNEKNINYVITPIAFWGNGWPEPDEDTPGFSNKYGKENSLTNPEAISAQQNYLAQFINHINPYTGVAYKDEPNLIAIEVSNEPHHKGMPEEVTAFINKMVSSIRSTGTQKPVFYNVSHSVHLAEAYFNAKIQGGTFQWYPTGLGFQKELEGNLLPNVNDYNIPFNDVIEENNAAKLVYEFDAADVMKSYIYPAMARSFREAGIQLATHFAYDPTYMAFANTEYNTHYMNLAYTPQKALALMISGEIFHNLPMNQETGTYPENLDFGNFMISYEEDLATLNSEEKFIYTNRNDHTPRNISKLKQIAGYSDSEVVKYDGTGAYFLDKLEEGVWRLEVMPDAIVVDNPFGKNSLDKRVGVIEWNTRTMNVDLPDLKKDFEVQSLNDGNTFSAEVSGKEFQIRPGTYLLKQNGTKFGFTGNQDWKSIKIKDFTAPETTVDKTYVLHQPPSTVSENSELLLSAEIISDREIKIAEAWFQNGNNYESVRLHPGSGFNFTAKVPDSLLAHGFLNYRIVVFTENGDYTFPSGVAGNPGDWDFYDEGKYTIHVVNKEAPLELFNAIEDYSKIVGEWKPGNQLVPTNFGGAEYQVKLDKLFKHDNENPTADTIYDYTFRYNILQKIMGRREQLSERKAIIVRARSLSGKKEKVQVAFVDKNGAAFGKIIELYPTVQDHEIALSELQPVKTVVLPRPYPSFLPYNFEHNNKAKFDIRNVEALQISLGPGFKGESLTEGHKIGISRILLE